MPPTRRHPTDGEAGDAGTATPRTAPRAGKRATQPTDDAAEPAAPVTGEAAAAGSGVAGALRQIITVPGTLARQVADDVVTTAQRPDAVLYLGGLVGLAVIGVLEWPVAAAAGVGVAVATGVRRARG